MSEDEVAALFEPESLEAVGWNGASHIISGQGDASTRRHLIGQTMRIGAATFRIVGIDYWRMQDGSTTRRFAAALQELPRGEA